MPRDERVSSDQHWHLEHVPEKLPPAEAGADFYREASYESRYVKAHDGTDLAVDFLIPDTEGKHTAVLYQTRYMRGLELRWPLSRFVGSRGLDLVNFEQKCYFLAAGLAVATLDVRGTGASYGRYRIPWASEQHQDAYDVIDFICSQPWSNQKVVLVGTSYEATAALFTVSKRHPAVQGCAALYPFWDAYQDIVCPGGIRHYKFVEDWGRFCHALDMNKLSKLPLRSRIFMQAIGRGCQPVIDVPAEKEAAAGQAGHKAAKQAAEQEGRRRLEAAVAEHCSWDPRSPSVRAIRFADEADMDVGLNLSQGSPTAVASEIAAAGVPLLLLAGWLDATASPAILCFLHAARASGSQLIIGPWAHGGMLNNDQRGPKPSKQRTCFRVKEIMLDFMLSHLQPGKPASTPAIANCNGMHPSPQHSAEASGSAAQEPTRQGQSGADSRAEDLPEAASSQGATQHGQAERLPGSSSAGPSAASQQQPAAAIRQPVHYYIMGHEGHWQAAHSWPPPEADQQLQLFLGLRPRDAEQEAGGTVTLGDGDAQHGVLHRQQQDRACRWEHEVSEKKYLKGLSRYEAMTRLTEPVVYKGFAKSGHIIFTSAQLPSPVTVIGAPMLDLWVESSDEDADVFVYLLDYDPELRKSRYVTEGMLRASHRRLQPQVPQGHPRAASQVPGQPFRSFERKDAQPLQPRVPAQLQFPLLPTAFCFAPGHCIRVTIAGADSKHFTVDLRQPRKLWVHSASGRPSSIMFTVSG